MIVNDENLSKDLVPVIKGIQNLVWQQNLQKAGTLLECANDYIAYVYKEMTGDSFVKPHKDDEKAMALYNARLDVVNASNKMRHCIAIFVDENNKKGKNDENN